MDRDRWSEVDKVFQEALATDPGHRAEFLETACQGDRELRDEVETLLIADREAGEFIGAPAIEIAALFDDSDVPCLSESQCLGSYRVLGLIARGGMGEVYLAEDTKLDRKVALKILATDLSAEAERIRRFRQEARTASALNHPNIVTIYDIGEDQGIHYIAMELVEGCTVRDRLAMGKMAVDQALRITLETASALQAAHRAGIAHRDIKPENIMVRTDGYVKVLDFGLAKLAERTVGDGPAAGSKTAGVVTEPGIVMGTARYMSPEQARGLAVDGRTDIFSLGVVLYEMLAGEAPFSAPTPIDSVALMLSKEPQPLSSYRDDLSPGFDGVVRKALQKDRDDRYVSMDEFIGDLEALQAQSAPLGRVSSGRLVFSAESGLTDSTVRSGRSEHSISKVPALRRANRAARLLDGAKRVRFWLAGAAVLAAASAFYFLPRTWTSNNAGAGSSARLGINSIAVLALVNSSGDPKAEYLSDGFTETLIDRLSKMSQLEVSSESAVFRYKGKNASPEMAGRELDVECVLTGNLSESGDSISIRLQLDSVADGRPLWTKGYDGSKRDVLDLQRRIAGELARVLAPQLTEADERRVTKQYTADPDAYFLYSQGRWYANQRNAGSLQKSVDLYEQAIQNDGNYALAFDGLADSYTLLADYGAMDPNDALSRAQRAVASALSRDQDLAEAHATLGHLELLYYDWDAAKAQLDRAIQIKPNYGEAHQLYANYYAALGRFGEAMNESALALRSDPLSPILNESRAFHLYLAGEYDKAIEQLDTILEKNAGFIPAHAVLGMVNLRKGKTDAAVGEFQKCVELSGRSPTYLQHLACAYAAKGQRDEALALIDEIKRARQDHFVPACYLALGYSALGDSMSAIRWLKKASDERDSELIFVNVDPAYENLKDSPGFADVLRRMKLG